MDNQYLQQQIDELKKEIENLKSSTTFPIEIENTLIQRGFQNVGDKILTLYSESGVGGNAFKEEYRNIKYRNISGYGIQRYTVNLSTDTCVSPNHGFEDGQYIAFKTTDPLVGLPGGLDSLIDSYKVLNATADTFQVTTNGVDPVDITSSGVGEQYAYVF